MEELVDLDGGCCGMQSVVAGRLLDRERGARWARLALVSLEDDATI